VNEETLSLNEMQDLVERLKFGSAVLFAILQKVYNLHDIDENEECQHCKVSYPCETAGILLEEFVPSLPDSPTASSDD